MTALVVVKGDFILRSMLNDVNFVECFPGITGRSRGGVGGWVGVGVLCAHCTGFLVIILSVKDRSRTYGTPDKWAL